MIVFARIIDGPLGAETERATRANHSAPDGPAGTDCAASVARTSAECAPPDGHAGTKRALSDGRAGAVVRFEGVVRELEPSATGTSDERTLIALDYETYDPMAQRELESLARSVASEHGLLSIVVLHSRGRVAVGETSFLLTVTAPHRAEALRALGEFIDRLKQDVPIWKRPVWAS